MGAHGTPWRRSTRCVSDLHCLEVAIAGPSVLIRNSQRPEPVLAFPRATWHEFLTAMRGGTLTN
jgi:hypothetical protein